MPKKPYKSDYRRMPLYVFLFCGLSISVMGLYLMITNNAAIGVSMPGKSAQDIGGQQLIVNGTYILLVGVIMSICPAYELLKIFFKNRN